jgi:hypothetical protein
MEYSQMPRKERKAKIPSKKIIVSSLFRDQKTRMRARRKVLTLERSLQNAGPKN